MKTSVIAILLGIVSFGAHANSNDKEVFISQALKISEPSAGNVSPIERSETTSDSERSLTKATKPVEVDSSYYSVNKFNFLFYLMYKLNYTEDSSIKENDTEKL